jgi:NDP-sugar pyrophosphorylase family protein
MESLIKNAFVLGAGLGTRLRSLTARRPKPLIPVCNRPLITFAFDHLINAGVTKLVVNTHHRHEIYAQFFPEKKYRDVPIFFRHEEVLLETGGGIKNVEDLLGGDPFIVYNGDILTDLPVEKAVRHHIASGNEVTLVLRSSGGPLAISLDGESGRITDIGSRLHAGVAGKFLFTGVYVVSPQFLTRIPAREKISVVPIFLEMIRRGEKLGGIVLDEGDWWDLGTREQYLAVHRHIFDFGFRISDFGKTLECASPNWIHATASIAPTARILGATAIGAGAVVGENAELRDCIVWENAQIAAGSSLRNCIVTAGQRVEGTHADADF